MEENQRKNYSKDIKNFIIEELKNDTDIDLLYEQVKEKGYRSDLESFGRYVRKLRKDFGIIKYNGSGLSEEDKKIIKVLESKKSIKVENLIDDLNCNRKELFKSINKCKRNGYEIIVDNDVVILSTTNSREAEKIQQISCDEITFGVVSDPHFGSKSCQITALNEFSQIMKKRGVKHVFVPGDLVAGHNVYPGQIHDLYAISASEQEQSTLLNLPSGFDYYILGGNHDYSFIKRGGGYNIISVISSKRSDVHYVGFDEADIPILDNVDVKLSHPSGGVPYAISYRLQKNIEQITISELQKIVRGAKEKPTVRFVLAGHLHIQMQAMFGSIWGAQCGCFEGQTNYLKRKGLVPSIGGWIVNASLGKNGLLKNFEAKFYIFNEIENDWKNYKHSIYQQKIDKPIFKK